MSSAAHPNNQTAAITVHERGTRSRTALPEGESDQADAARERPDCRGLRQDQPPRRAELAPAARLSRLRAEGMKAIAAGRSSSLWSGLPTDRGDEDQQATYHQARGRQPLGGRPEAVAEFGAEVGADQWHDHFEDLRRRRRTTTCCSRGRPSMPMLVATARLSRPTSRPSATIPTAPSSLSVGVTRPGRRSSEHRHPGR